ncbi:hypothetical protein SESBI_01666 [Sesbania bispinosa]|nr:hypothetical protein SESBI_01666 [Sesbania bispinosa]
MEYSEGNKVREACKIDESHKDNSTNLKNNDGGINQENQILLSIVREDQVRSCKFQTTSCRTQARRIGNGQLGPRDLCKMSRK